MKYVIVNTENESLSNPAPYLSSLSLQRSVFPSKSWSHVFDDAIKFESEKDAKTIINLLRINTPDAMQIREVDESYAPYDERDKAGVDSGKKELFFKSAKAYYPARIICSNRKGIKNGAGNPVPLVVLVKHPKEGEILFEATINGEAYSAQRGQHQALYIKYGK